MIFFAKNRKDFSVQKNTVSGTIPESSFFAFHYSMEKIVWAVLQRFIISENSSPIFRSRYFPGPLSTYLESVRYTLQGRGAKCPLHPRPQGLPSSYLRTPGYVTREPHTSHGVRFEFAARLGRTPAKYECDVDDSFFLKF